MLNEDFSQPFFVSQEKRYLFRGVSPSGYLPALEPHIEETIPEPQYTVRGLSLKEREPPLPEPTISYQPDLPTLRYFKPKHLNWKQVSMWSALFEEQEHRKLLEKKLKEHLDEPKRKPTHRYK